MEPTITYATVCSGIECMSVACRGLPLKPVFFSEIEPFPCAVLKAHYPDVPNLGDMSKITVTNKTEITNGTVRLILERPLDILAGGTPCQDVSVAGKRAGMQEGSGTRSSLAFDFVRLARELGPRYVIWENVAGAIDSKNAPDFLAFLRALGDCGYSLAWRVLDAQYVRVDGMERAVPQRRRRVWVVGCLGADESLAGKILFEPDCVAGHTAPRRRTGEGFAYSLAGRDRVDARLVGEPAARVCSCSAKQQSLAADEQLAASLGSNDYKEPQCIALDGDKLKPREDQRKGGNGFGINEEGAGYTLTGVDRHDVAYENDHLNRCEVARSLNGDHDDRVMDSGTSVVHVSMAQNTRDEVRIVGGDGQIAGALPAEPRMKQQTYVVSTQGLDGYNQQMTGECAPTLRLCKSDADLVPSIISTNSSRDTEPIGIGRDVSPTLSHQPSALEPTVAQSNIAQMRYIVRRLTPTECERLMGLPDGYTIPTGLRRFFNANGEPTPELVAEFQRTFDTFNAIMADYAHAKPPKPKSAKQVAEWLKKVSDPATCPDSPRYKACGNGWATNQPRWILMRLLAIGEGMDPFDNQQEA